jgi:hypothetical protein
VDAAAATRWIQARELEDLGSIDGVSDAELQAELIEAFEFWQVMCGPTTEETSMSYKLNGVSQNATTTPGERVERLERKADLRSDAAPDDLVERVGEDLWTLGGRTLTTEELDVELEKQSEAAEAENQLRRDLNLDAPRVEGEALHRQAIELLHSRGVHQPTADELLSVYEELGAP